MPDNPDKKIIRFIKQHHILTLATSNKNKPYCCTCFYAYLEEKNIFILTSDKDTKHASDIMEQDYIAGAIALETYIVGKIRGVQFTGKIKEAKGSELKDLRKAYLRKFPFAILKQTPLWSVEPDFIKMTDNRLGFGKKLVWKKNMV